MKFHKITPEIAYTKQESKEDKTKKNSLYDVDSQLG